MHAGKDSTSTALSAARCLPEPVLKLVLRLLELGAHSRLAICGVLELLGRQLVHHVVQALLDHVEGDLLAVCRAAGMGAVNELLHAGMVPTHPPAHLAKMVNKSSAC